MVACARNLWSNRCSSVTVLSHEVSTVTSMSLIDQARELVRGLAAAEDEYRHSADLAEDAAVTNADEVERIVAEWESQPHHP